MTSSRSILFFLSLTVLVAPNVAFAYLDPGTGSMVLQLLIAGIVGALFTLKTYWQRVKGFCFGLFRKSDSSRTGA